MHFDVIKIKFFQLWGITKLCFNRITSQTLAVKLPTYLHSTMVRGFLWTADA
jgi:hypothetical protein